MSPFLGGIRLQIFFGLFSFGSGSSIVVSVISLTVALSSAIIAVFAFRFSKRQLAHNAYFNLQSEYGSPEMSFAIRRLYNLYNECKNKSSKIDTEYMIKYKEERSHQNIDEEKDTLHFQRRLVTEFYQKMAVFYVCKIIPEYLIYKGWKKKDLRKIILEIIIPIERAIYIDENKNDVGFVSTITDLRALERDAPNC